MDVYEFRIDFIPTKRRPRFARGRAYTDKRTTDEMKAIASAYQGKLYEGAVGLEIVTHAKLPSSTPKRITERMNLFKPDIDNTAKCVMDALNGKAYADDSQVTTLRAMKEPQTRIEQPYTEIKIWSKPWDTPK